MSETTPPVAPLNEQPSTPPATRDINTDYLVQYLMASCIAGWQLYAMARTMFDDLPMYSDEDKQKFFESIAKKYIADESGNTVPFKPIHTIESLKQTVLPFWLAKIAAEQQLADLDKANKPTPPVPQEPVAEAPKVTG